MERSESVSSVNFVINVEMSVHNGTELKINKYGETRVYLLATFLTIVAILDQSAFWVHQDMYTFEG